MLNQAQWQFQSLDHDYQSSMNHQYCRAYICPSALKHLKQDDGPAHCATYHAVCVNVLIEHPRCRGDVQALSWSRPLQQPSFQCHMPLYDPLLSLFSSFLQTNMQNPCSFCKNLASIHNDPHCHASLQTLFFWGAALVSTGSQNYF